MRYVTINGVTRYYESHFNSPKDFNDFAEFWEADIVYEKDNKIILTISHKTIKL